MIGVKHMPPEYRAAYEAGQHEARGHYQEVPASPHYVYVEKPEEGFKSRSSIEHLTVPIALAASVLVACMVGAFWTATQFANVQNSIENLYEKIENTFNPVVDRIRKVELELERRTQSRWTKADHELWCARTEQANAHLNWRCGNHIAGGGIMGRELESPPIWSGAKDAANAWQTEEKGNR